LVCEKRKGERPEEGVEGWVFSPRNYVITNIREACDVAKVGLQNTLSKGEFILLLFS
jgi:hypothetical protein